MPVAVAHKHSSLRKTLRQPANATSSSLRPKGAVSFHPAHAHGLGPYSKERTDDRMASDASMAIPEATQFLLRNAYYSPLLFHETEFYPDGTPILEAFDPNDIEPDSTIIRFGRRRTGKSFSTRWDLSHLTQYFPRGIVFSNTENMNHFFEDFIPYRFIFRNGLDEEVLEQFLDMVNSFKFDKKQHEELLKLDPNYNRSFVIFDDVVSTINSVRWVEPIGRMFSLGRHSDAMINFNTQYINAVTPLMKENCDLAYIFQARGKRTIEGLYDSYVFSARQ